MHGDPFYHRGRWRGGRPRTHSRFPVRYPTASSSQAWATAAPFLWLRIMLGIEPDRGKLILNPDVPKQCGKIVVRGVHAFGQRFDVTGDGRMGASDPRVRPVDHVA